MARIHIHTKYSLLDAIIEPEQLVQKIKEQDSDNAALCVTEHGNLYSNVEIYKLCKKYGVKYLLGCEMYICDDVNVRSKDNKYYHLVVIAKDENGRLNLNKLVSESCKYKYWGKPRIDFSMLQQYKNGLIVLSACMAGEVQKALMNGDITLAKNIAIQYKSVFGEDYYLEYQSHSEPTQQKLNRQIVDLAKELDIKYVVTTDAHYLTKEDQKYHSIFVQIGQAREVGETYNDCYLQSNEEILEKCKSTTEEENFIAINNTDEIASKCNVELPLSAPIMPHVDVPSGIKSEIEYLKKLCIDGWYIKKIDKKPNKEEYKNRLRYEMNCIQKMGFEGYYLFVWSYANSVKRRGLARGSGGGSLVAYLSNIVDIDPIEYGLYFERFIDVGALELLNQGKITKNDLKIPDFDLDFGKEDRKRVLQFVIDKYGQNRVASLGSFQYIWAKGAIKDIGRVLNIPFEITNEMTSYLEEETINEVIELGLLDKYKNQYPELFVYAEKLAGLPKSFSAHPCFVADTLVLTDNGYKKISDVQIGDKVLTHKNNYKLVANLTKNNSNNIFTINHCGGFDIKCTNNHPFYVRHRIKEKPKVYSEPEWVNAENIVKGDVLCLPINNNCKLKKYKNLPIDNKNFWWLIGRYIGDGWYLYYELPRNTKDVVICCDKKDNSEFEEIVSHLNNMFDYRYVIENTTIKIYIKNIELFEYLQRFGKCAHGKHLTSDIFDLPIDYIKSFLDGYISADGYIDKQGFVNIKTVSYELANGIIQCVAKAYHKHCGTHTLQSGIDIIQGRKVNRREKYIVYYFPYKTNGQRNFYDDKRNCIWSFVKSVNKENIVTDVYNLSVVDDNTYTANGAAVHNCGKVASMNDMIYYNATDINDDGEVILQGDMHTAEDLGLIKADFLGLRTVDVIYDTLEMIEKDYEYIAPHNLNFNDKKVYENFKNGFTAGIFQFESFGMQDTLKKIECSCLEDLIVANALFRPGSIKYIDNYANRKKGIEEFEYLHPDLEPILKNTYGIIVFQEQLIEIGKLAKLSNPDELRKATAKKKAELLDKIKPELYYGLSYRGWSIKQMDLLWDTMVDFAKYSFNRSHSAAYAMIAYICMYLKTYYSKEFICAWINSVSDKVKKVGECVSEATRMGIEIYLGKYNNCSSICKVYNNGIMMGTKTIKYCNESISNELMSLPQCSSFIDLIDKIIDTTSINIRQLSILVGLNFFSDFGKNKYLMKILDLYNGIEKQQPNSNKKTKILPSLKSVKQISKDKIDSYAEYGLTEYLIKKYSKKETPKQYSQIDNVGLLNEMISRLSNESMSVQEYVRFEKEYLQYTTYINPSIADYYYIVTDFQAGKDTTRPRLVLRQLKTGNEIKTRIRESRVFRNNPFGEFSILKVEGFEKRFKTKYIDGEWKSSDELEDILYEYEIIKQ